MSERERTPLLSPHNNVREEEVKEEEDEDQRWAHEHNMDQIGKVILLFLSLSFISLSSLSSLTHFSPTPSLFLYFP